MFQIIRPCLTTGVALVAVGVIAIAPITVTPPGLAAAELVTCIDTAAQTVPVELAGFVEDMTFAISQTLRFYPLLLGGLAPLLVLNAVINRRIASLVPITAYIAMYAVTGPIEALAGPFIKNLPLPFGTDDGVVSNAVEIFKTVPTLLVSLLQAPADLLDGALTLPEAIDGSVSAVVTAFTTPVEALQKMVAALVGVVPVAAPAAVALPTTRPTAAVTALPAAEANTTVVTQDVGPADPTPLRKSGKAKPAVGTNSESKTVGLQQVRGNGSASAHEKSAKPAAAPADHAPKKKRVSASPSE